jgi:diketogulonate reductase-like aldo/keto reductase
MQENGVQIESWGPFAEGRNRIFENDLLLSIAAQHSRSVAQVILRWLIQRVVVAIPKSVREARMIENFSVFDFELSREEMDRIATLETKASSFFDHRHTETVKRLGRARLNI